MKSLRKANWKAKKENTESVVQRILSFIDGMLEVTTGQDKVDIVDTLVFIDEKRIAELRELTHSHLIYQS